MFVLHFLPLNVENLIHARPEACLPSFAKCPVSEHPYRTKGLEGRPSLGFCPTDEWGPSSRVDRFTFRCAIHKLPVKTFRKPEIYTCSFSYPGWITLPIERDVKTFWRTTGYFITALKRIHGDAEKEMSTLPSARLRFLAVSRHAAARRLAPGLKQHG